MLNLEKTKEILGEKANDMSEKDIAEMRDLAAAFTEMAFENLTTEKVQEMNRSIDTQESDKNSK